MLSLRAEDSKHDNSKRESSERRASQDEKEVEET